MANQSSLLINEPPLQVLPSLAAAIGLEEAIFVQRIHQLTVEQGTAYESRRWITATQQALADGDFPWMSPDAVRRVLATLRRRGLVLATSAFNSRPTDRTLWYTVDYDVVVDRIAQHG